MKKSVLFMVFGWLLAVSAWPQSGTCGDNLTWELKDGTLTISGTGAMEDYDFDYYSPWYNDRESILSVVISEGTTSIGNYAFNRCNNLNTITISNSVTSIGNSVFNLCSSLNSVTLSNNVTSIGDGAFCRCSSLNSVTLPNCLASIGEGAFDSCSSLTSVTIPNSVTTIGYWAFFRCSSLSSITIPDNVTSIGYWAFFDCSSLTSITIPDRVTNIGKFAFNRCNSLTQIEVHPENPAFMSQKGVLFSKDETQLIVYPNGKMDESYTIPNSVTSIGEFAFAGCGSLTSITIPNSVSSIRESAFSDCNSLSEITSLNPTPPALDYSVFSGVNTSICSLKIPTGSKAAYKAADGWRNFLNIAEGASSLLPLSNETASFVFTEYGIQITGCDPQEQVGVYTSAGREVCRTIVGGGSIRCLLTKGETYIVRIGQKAVKAIKW